MIKEKAIIGQFCLPSSAIRRIPSPCICSGSGIGMSPPPIAPCMAEGSTPPTNNGTIKVTAPLSTTQASTCVRPTAPAPRILPSIRSKGRTLDIITSTIRFVFSSITDFITIWPYIITIKNMIKAMIPPIASPIPAVYLLSSSPSPLILSGSMAISVSRVSRLLRSRRSESILKSRIFPAILRSIALLFSGASLSSE